MIRELLILNLIFLAGFIVFRNIKSSAVIWIPASFTLFISIMLLPLLLDIEHKFSNISVAISILICSFLIIYNLKSIKIKALGIITIFFFVSLNLYIFITSDLLKRFTQLTPDTYKYMFIARAINSPEGVTDISQGTLLLRGLNLPLLLAIFEGEYVSSILPSIIIILNFLALLAFCKEYGILKSRRNYIEFLIISLLFLTTLQGFYLIFYITTHGIISLSIVLFFGTLVKYKLNKENITLQDHLILYSSLLTFIFIRPEGIIFSLLMIIFAFQYLNLSLRILRIYLYPTLMLIIYWFLSLNLLEDTFRTRIAVVAFSFLLILSIIYIEFICKKNLTFAIKLLNAALILSCVISVGATIGLLAKSFPACFQLSFLNAGGLALVPALMILSYLYISLKFKTSNKVLMQISLSGIALTHLIIPILNGNQWICGYYGWGETIARSYIHFMLLFALGYLVSRRKITEHI
jgi:hypothetical protein